MKQIHWSNLLQGKRQKENGHSNSKLTFANSYQLWIYTTPWPPPPPPHPYLTWKNRTDKRDQTSSSSDIPRGLVHAYGFVTIPKLHPWAHHSSLHKGPTPLNAIFPSSIHLIKDFNFYCGFRFSYITSKIHRYLTQLCMFYTIAGCLLRILVDLHLLPNFG